MFIDPEIVEDDRGRVPRAINITPLRGFTRSLTRGLCPESVKGNSVVILQPQMCDQIFASQVTQSVLELH